MGAVYLLVLLLLHWVAPEDVFPQERATSNETAPEVPYNTAQDRSNDDLKIAIKTTTTTYAVFKGLVDYIPDQPEKELKGLEKIFKFKPKRTDKALKGFSKLFKKLGPALGIAGALLSAFLPDGTAQALEKIQKQLTEMDDKLTSLGNQIDELGDKMLLEHGLTRANTDITALFVACEALDAYLNAPQLDGHVDVIKDLYTDKAQLYKHIKGTYGTLNGQINKGPPLFKDMYTASRGDWSYIQRMHMHFQTMLVKSIAAYTLGCKLNGKSTGVCEEEAAWLPGKDQNLQTTLDENLQRELMNCRKEYFQNRKADVEKLLEDNSGLNNQDLADEVARFVRNKYFWKDQTILVYNVDVIGDENHAGSGGLLLKVGDDRRIRILDGDTVPNTFSPTTIPSKVSRCDIVQRCDITNANSLFGGTKGSGWYRKRASTLRDGFESQLREKGFKSTQTAVIQKSKTVSNIFEGDVEEGDTQTRWNLGNNGKLIVGGTNTELYTHTTHRSRTRSSSDSTYYYFFIQIKDKEFACEGEESCCGGGNVCGIGEGDCDTDSDCISGIYFINKSDLLSNVYFKALNCRKMWC